jgi:glycosyltransferase involved in cell wall biosynthesis
MLGTHHSWAVTMRNLIYQIEKKKHNLFLKTTNGTSLFPKEWEKYLNKSHKNPDIDLCYTLPRNFGARFRGKSKLKMAIYNYETSHMPAMWLKNIKFVDYVLPSSNFSKEVFVNSGWPEDKCIVVPHGVNIEEYSDKSKINLHNDKSFRFLNVSIAHYRKNINLLVDAYYSAFTDTDDVCLVIKTKLDPPSRKLYRFECNVSQQIIEMQKKHLQAGRKLPQIEIIQDRLDSMIPLYNSCDALVSATSSEGFGLPLLEGLAANMIVIAPGCTGQLDFLNNKNSLVVDFKTIDAGSKYQYWRPTEGATTFLPKVSSLSEQMINAYNNRKTLISDFKDERARILKKFTWENAAKQILEIK